MKFVNIFLLYLWIIYMLRDVILDTEFRLCS